MTKLGLKTDLRIGTWNVRTMMEPSKLDQALKEFSNYKLALLGLSEIRWPGNGELRLNNGNYLLYSGNNDDDTREKGVGLILTKEMRKSLNNWQPISERIITARFKTRARNLSIIQCYAPTELDSPENKDLFYQQLTHTISKVAKGDIKMLIGDFNAQVGNNNDGIEHVLGRQGLGTRNDNGDRLIDLCNSFQMTIGGTLFIHKRIHKVTWVSPDKKTENQIDHLIIDRKWRRSLLDVRNRRGADIASDHHLLTGVIRFKLAAARKNTPNANRQRFDLLKLKNPFTLKQYNQKLNESISQLNQSPTKNLSWKKVGDTILNTAKSVIGFKEKGRKGWISEDTWSLIAERKLAKNLVNKDTDADEKEKRRRKYIDLCTKVKRSARNDKRTWYNDIADRAEVAAATGNLKELYELTNILANKKRPGYFSIKDQTGKLLTDDKEQVERWYEYYRELLENSQPCETPDIPQPSQNILHINTNVPTIAEIKEAIKKLKTSKAAGPDNLPCDLLKTDCNLLAKTLHPILAHIWHSNTIPSEWKEGLIINLPKKGDLSDCKNWRGITLLNSIYKILAGLILNRIADSLEPKLLKEQAGFRPGRSCVDHINALRLIVEQSTEFRSPLYLVFVDFERAFDTLNHQSMYKVLQAIGIPHKLISLIQHLYKDSSSKILHNNQKSRSISIKTGVKQGCLMSPLLFNLSLDWVLKHLNKQDRGIRWTLFSRLEELAYADDICLLAHTYDDMQDKINLLKQLAAQVGLKINVAKTKAMRIHTTCTNKLTIGNQEIEEVDKFCYLGSIISKTGGTMEDILQRINKARCAFSKLNNVWRCPQISRLTKIRIFNTNVKSVLLYACETWKVTNAISSKIQTFVNRCLRRVCRVKYYDVVTNTQLWHMANQIEIACEIRKRKWRWLGHTLRKDQTDIARTALDWNPQGSRRVGRPTTTWRRTVMKEINDVGKSWPEIKNLARNRVRWKRFVEALCSN